MPRLTVLGQKFSVGSDDFFLPAFVGVINKASFSAFAVLFLVLTSGSLLGQCDEPSQGPESTFLILLGAFLALQMAAFVTYCAMLYVSTRGTPADHERRTAMPGILMITSLIYVMEALFAGGFTYVAIAWPSAASEECNSVLQKKFSILIFSVICIWIDFITFLGATYMFLHRYDAKHVSGLNLNDFDMRTIAWENCFKVWCRVLRVVTCNLFGFVASGEESEEVYRSVAESFNVFFTNTDLTLTDLVIGFILVRLDQKRKRRDLERYEQHASPESEFHENKMAKKKKFNMLSNSVRALQVQPEEGDIEQGNREIQTEEAWAIFKEHEKYLPYMIGMYGWKVLLYSHAVSFKSITGFRKLMHMPNERIDVGHGDNWCMCSKNALLKETGVSPEQVVYANFGSVAKDSKKSIQVPHAIFADHERKAVVVAMRGTLSLQDLMTDAMIEPVSLVEAGRTWGFNGTGHYAHEGMLKTAMRIRRILEKNLVIHHMLGVQPKSFEYTDNIELDGHEAMNMEVHELPTCTGYDLIITGHSLGGAAAMLLTMMLRPTFPNARCVGYAIPGAVVSYDLAEQCKPWCTNLWLGNDIVPHLNFRNLFKLRLSVLDVLYRCKVSKARVFRSVLTGQSAADLLYEPFEVPQTEGRLKYKKKIEEFKEKRKSTKIEQIPMYAPGVLIHLAKLETVYERRWLLFQKKKYVYEPFLVQNREDMHECPIVSSRSLFDHFPNLLPIYMHDIVERHKARFDKDETSL